MTFDAGGAPRQARVVCRRSQPPHSSMKCHGQVNIWVEDLTEEEAQQMLELKGHAEDWKQFTAACLLAALSARVVG